MRAIPPAALALLLAAGCAHATGPDLACPPGTVLRENSRDARCETPNGVAEGPTFGRYGNGRLRYYGTSRNGKTEGPWTSWNQDGTVSIEANYEGGELVGWFRRFDAHGVLQSEGQHDRRGRMDGVWTSYWPNGRVRTRWTMAHGEQDGPVATWYESGARKSEGQRARGRSDGDWTWFAEDGSVAARCRYDQGRVVEGDCSVPTARRE